MTMLVRGVVALVLLATTPAVAETSAPVSGRWYSEGIEKGGYFQFIDSIHDDGAFTLEAREIRGCKPGPPWTEAGTWTYSGDSIHKVTKVVAGDSVPDTDEYHDTFAVTVLDKDRQSWVDAKTKIAWNLTRVSPDFSFPIPKPCATS